MTTTFSICNEEINLIIHYCKICWHKIANPQFLWVRNWLLKITYQVVTFVVSLISYLFFHFPIISFIISCPNHCISLLKDLSAYNR